VPSPSLGAVIILALTIATVVMLSVLWWCVKYRGATRRPSFVSTRRRLRDFTIALTDTHPAADLRPLGTAESTPRGRHVDPLLSTDSSSGVSPRASPHLGIDASDSTHALAPATGRSTEGESSLSVGSHPVVLESVLGRGGFSTVWRGQWMLSTVAVKVFTEVSMSESAMRKFQMEAKTLRTLRHPNICYFFDTGILEAAPVIVLELLSGGTLGQYLCLAGPSALAAATGTGDNEVADITAAAGASDEWKSIASSELLQLAKDVALGLHYLHTHGVTHRDVKNANVMIDRGQTVRAKLCDFGISALKSATHEHGLPRSFSSLGTARYQAPEMTKLMGACNGRAVPDEQLEVVHHARVDCYSYGLLLYEIMHGRVFFSGFNAIAVMMQAKIGRRPTIALRWEHTDLASLIVACWDAEPERRPSMEKVVNALSALEAKELSSV